jgi:transposase, IS30 family
MGERYGQLSLEERVEIYRLHAGGKSFRSIGSALGRAPSTIQREVKRNGRPIGVWPGGYDPVRADDLARWRRRRDKRHKLARQPDLRDLVRNSLAMGMSPEQIAGRLTREKGHTVISHESIYRYVYHRSAAKDYWHRLLPRRKSRRGRLGARGGSPARLMQRRRPIGERPSEAADRQTPGHWEADYMLFSKSGQSLLIVHERKARYTLIARPPDRKAAGTVAFLLKLLKPMPQELRKSLTIDNGTEFALHYRLTDQLGIDTFFCDTHSPWQKGGIENAIGRLRRRLPRKTDLATLSSRDIADIVNAYNHTPRKCLDFQTPAEAFSKLQETVALQT